MKQMSPSDEAPLRAPEKAVGPDASSQSEGSPQGCGA
jgi:hypothetical protein